MSYSNTVLGTLKVDVTHFTPAHSDIMSNFPSSNGICNQIQYLWFGPPSTSRVLSKLVAFQGYINMVCRRAAQEGRCQSAVTVAVMEQVERSLHS